jgi:hypothetical protein
MLALLTAESISACTRVTASSNAMVNITDTVFDGCSSTTAGGAVSADITGIAAIRSCNFISCSSSSTGGAIYSKVGDLQIAACSILNCNSSVGTSSLYSVYSSNGGEATGCSVTGGHCTENTWNMEGYSSAKQTIVRGMNLTANTATYTGAAMRFDLAELFFEFCEIRSNTGPCLFFIAANVKSQLIGCLSIRSNQCLGEGLINQGLFRAKASIVISDSVICENSVLFHVHPDSGVTVTFNRCLMDSLSLSATGAGALASASCSLITAPFPAIAPTCLTRSAIMTESVPFQRSASISPTILLETSHSQTKETIPAILSGACTFHSRCDYRLLLFLLSNLPSLC